jgi:hypothetical protein
VTKESFTLACLECSFVSTLFNDPTCRICGLGNEETNHLFAYCEGLTQIRMKVCGLTILSEPFTWTPTTLLAMIREIEKICPEEGQLNLRDIEYDLINTDSNTDPMTE